jgi:hypothetical protein
MKKLMFIAILIAGASVAAQAQAPCSKGTKFRNCKACGSASSAKGQNLNVLKNRDAAATSPQEVTVAEIRKAANNTGHFDPTQQVAVTGYVASLDKGGFQESCNCGRNDLRDIHINLVAKASERNDKTKFVVVEITPRWQEKLGLDDSNYDQMLGKVKTQIVHKFVKFEGWMMSDSFHVTESKNTAKSTTPTCKDDGNTWEVHPVTKYTVVTAP